MNPDKGTCPRTNPMDIIKHAMSKTEKKPSFDDWFNELLNDCFDAYTDNKKTTKKEKLQTISQIVRGKINEINPNFIENFCRSLKEHIEYILITNGIKSQVLTTDEQEVVTKVLSQSGGKKKNGGEGVTVTVVLIGTLIVAILSFLLGGVTFTDEDKTKMKMKWNMFKGNAIATVKAAYHRCFSRNQVGVSDAEITAWGVPVPGSIVPGQPMRSEIPITTVHIRDPENYQPQYPPIPDNVRMEGGNVTFYKEGKKHTRKIRLNKRGTRSVMFGGQLIPVSKLKTTHE